ncbi:small ribosomal subunit protein mS78 (rPPR3a)-like, partial [Lycium barbarum]|uniref:small ribosomal subunit protein mS78 (rPPR3a)-like n=1 Tax=Lycium barbarum TaxID=112863 RepID=UPI00293E9303
AIKCPLLSGVFTNNHKAPTITRSTPTTQAIVDSFKISSECPNFRRECFHYETAIRQLIKAKHFSGIIDIIEHQKRYPDIRNESFVKMYTHARQLFDEMPQLNCPRTVFSFNALLEAYLKSERYNKIADLFRELPTKLSIEPDIVSYNTAIKALCKVGSLDSAVYLMDEIENHGIKLNTVTCNTLLSAFHENKRFTEAESLWIMMEKRNIVPNLCSYNIKLISLVKANEVSKAIQFFEEIVSKGFKPDPFSYSAMIKMCVRVRNLEDAKMWYEKMMQSGCLPDYKLFTTLTTFACSAHDFDFALHSRKGIHNNVMQRVVNGLVEHSKVENAKELVKLAESYKSFHYELSLPLHI